MAYNPEVLSGIKIVELGAYAAVPAATRMFADWGADVIKVESHSGDPMRSFGAGCSCPIADDENPIWQVLNGNKRSITLNLKTAEGKKVLFKLLEQADAFVTNTRIESLKKMGLDYDSLKERFPKLVWGHMSGYGLYGPDHAQPGFDVVSYWARGGASVDVAPAGGYPLSNTAGLGDNTCALALASGVLAGILKAKMTGKGEMVCASLFGTSIWTGSLMITSTQDKYGDKYPKTHYEPQHPLNHSYRCKDGEWIAICILDYRRYFARLCEIVGHPEYAENPRFNTIPECRKPENMPFFIDLLDQAFLQKNREEWCRLFEENDIAHGRLLHFNEVSKDEQAWANHYLHDFEFPNGERAAIPATPVQFQRNEEFVDRLAPALGGNSLEILNQLGYSAAEIDHLKEIGAV